MTHRDEVDQHLAGKVTVPTDLIDRVLGILGEDGYTIDDENYGPTVEELLSYSTTPHALDQADPLPECEYRVEWNIDLSATSSRDAAAKAFEMVRRPDTTANVFGVQLKEDVGTKRGRVIDLSMPVLDLQKVCDIVKGWGIPCYVEQTGGGCATIYAGTQTAGKPRTTVGHGPDDSDPRWQCIAGPGWFEGPEWSEPHASLGEFYIGPDDDGATDPTFTTDEGDDEASVATKILHVVRLNERTGS